MLLDARGHLKLTDLGLCKKIGDASPHEEPEVILEMLRRQTISGDGTTSTESVSAEEGPLDDGTMSIDGSAAVAKRDNKTRREVRTKVSCYLRNIVLFLNFFILSRWHTRRLVPLIT